MGFRYDSYCGLNCGACPVGAANELGNEEFLRSMAEEWDRDLDDLRCNGCKTDVTAAFCTDCRMRQCAREKGVEFCVHCGDFPCDVISQFRNDEAPHHSAVLYNLQRIKELGLKDWLEAEAGRWSCPECGRRFTWYSESCAGCGGELYNAVSQDRDLEGS